MGNRALWMLAGVAALAGAAPAWAQDNEDAALAALAAESQPTEGQAIDGARTLTGQGDLLGAVATLERALLANPNANNARLYYAATLCRLGDMQGARIELAKLDRQETADALWRETDQACGSAFARPAPPDNGGGSRLVRGDVFAGLAWDSNLSGATQLVFDYLSPPPKEGGLSHVLGGRAHGQSAGYSRTIGIYLGANAYWKRSISGAQLSYSLLEGTAGFGREDGRIGPRVGVVVRRLGLDGSAYSYDLGGQLAFGVGRLDKLRITPSFELVDQHFFGTLPGPLANGMRLEGEIAADGRIGEDGAFHLSVGGEKKDAGYYLFAYRALRLTAAGQLPVGGHGIYARAGGSYRLVNYDDPDTDFGVKRRDRRAFVEGAVGLPLVRRDLFLEGAVNYTIRNTSLDSAATGDPLTYQIRDYHSLGTQARLVYKY